MATFAKNALSPTKSNHFRKAVLTLLEVYYMQFCVTSRLTIFILLRESPKCTENIFQAKGYVDTYITCMYNVYQFCQKV